MNCNNKVIFGWSLGMPLIRKLDTDLWVVRSYINDRIVWVIFTVMARRMKTNHTAVRRLLDADNTSVTLTTLVRTSRALSEYLQLGLAR